MRGIDKSRDCCVNEFPLTAITERPWLTRCSVVEKASKPAPVTTMSALTAPKNGSS